MKPLILDSALGTELENRGEYLPSFKTSIWSAYSLIHSPEVIKQIHIDNIEAGADIITTSNYQATPELLKREPTAPSYEDLAKRSLELCQEAIIKAGTNTKIAGCYPPIHVTFRPDLSAKEKNLRKFYETLGSIYHDGVDLIISASFVVMRLPKACRVFWVSRIAGWDKARVFNDLRHDHHRSRQCCP